MSKDLCEDYRKLSVYRLRDFGCFSRSSLYDISWGKGENRSSIDLTTYLENSPPRMRLNYVYTNRYSDRKVSVEEDITLSKMQCHFGGVRWWMHCPISRGGASCDRRTAILFMVGGRFGCRYCHYLTYESQKVRRAFRPYLKLFIPITLDQKYARSRYWKGQKTKRTRRIDAKLDTWEEPVGLMNF